MVKALENSLLKVRLRYRTSTHRYISCGRNDPIQRPREFIRLTGDFRFRAVEKQTEDPVDSEMKAHRGLLLFGGEGSVVFLDITKFQPFNPAIGGSLHACPNCATPIGKSQC